MKMLIDACFSGGLIEELLDALPRVVGTTTCTRKAGGRPPDVPRGRGTDTTAPRRTAGRGRTRFSWRVW